VKHLLFITSICFLISCSKSSSSYNNSGGSGSTGTPPVTNTPGVTFSAQATTTSWTIPLTSYTVDSNISCTLQADSASGSGVFSGQVYVFNFNQITSPADYGVTLVLPANNYPSFQFPLNTAININYDSSFYNQLILMSSVVFTSTEYIGPCDSTNFTLTITRNSNNTIDGTFSANYYEGVALQTQPTGVGMVTNGVFKNVPLKTK
jgi:hypothetical protein